MKNIRYFLEFIVVRCFIALARCLGIDLASNLFASIARIIGPVLPVSKVASRNIKQVFPNYTPSQVSQVISQTWDNIARIVAELPNIFCLSTKEFYQKTEIIGNKYLLAVAKSGKPCIFITGHFANWEISTKIGCDAGLKLAIVYRKANNFFVDKEIIKFRQNLDVIQIPKGKEGIKDIVKALKENRCLCFLPDQKLNNGIEVPFFGKKAMTASAPAKLALDYGCQIIPIQVVRKNGANFAVTVHKPLKINHDQNNSQEIYRIMREINYIYEQWIKENPGQWFWLHKRWPKEFYE